MRGWIPDIWLGAERFVILGLPLAILVALLVSRRVRDGRWRAVLRVALAIYLVASLF